MRHMRIWTYVDEAARLGSLRKAAEKLNITPSALQRRIRDVEEDLGTPIFERTAQGIHLTAAGEGMVRWIRGQSADLERLKSQIEDMSGLRRGNVRIACSQALVPFFLPQEISEFRSRFPQVRFSVEVQDHGVALRMLRDFECDLAIVFRPDRSPDIHPLFVLGQRLVAIMRRDHPLAERDQLRLRDCAAYPVALPSSGFGTRAIIDDLLAGSSTRFDVQLQSNSFEMLRNLASSGDVVTFQAEIGAPREDPDGELVYRVLSDRDLAHGPLVVCQLKGRTLPVAAAKFAEQLSRSLEAIRSTPGPDV
ncbi:LysR family transcriptional regulator [Jiella avicenniae]|uniref:LysR substrate-binding domain-containing protein n=1 Tax=Jiella avicenniae TaxID=2907202 RepID=A0A9X1NWN5_9HYPH|nr:LysR substrate-binding domain-containing protein [Jiella avicenniae]MCE7027135.1 LysR substrate-binding domain-containing protein [Jiella avicenniae]